MYASVFFLTAMSITRYWSVASALKIPSRKKSASVKWISAVLWILATVATAPTSIFSTVTVVAGEKLCLLKFPEGHDWLALYHLQKIVVAFILPMFILSVCYLSLLRFIRVNNRQRRRSKVAKSVTVVVLSFFICWMPNHAITLWGVLVKLNAVHWDKSYYMVHAYVFPVTVCLAHTNSCLNPVLYCLMRREFRKMLHSFFWRVSTPVVSNAGKLHGYSAGSNQTHDDAHIGIHLNVIDARSRPQSAHWTEGCSWECYASLKRFYLFAHIHAECGFKKKKKEAKYAFFLLCLIYFRDSEFTKYVWIWNGKKNTLKCM